MNEAYEHKGQIVLNTIELVYLSRISAQDKEWVYIGRGSEKKLQGYFELNSDSKEKFIQLARELEKEIRKYESENTEWFKEPYHDICNSECIYWSLGTPKPIAFFAGYQYFFEEIYNMEPVPLNEF